MSKKLIIVLYLFLLSGVVSSNSIDSLKSVADTATGKNLCRVYGDISSYYWKRNPFLSMEYAKKSLREVQNFLEDTTLYIAALQLMGDAYWYNNNPANSLEYGLEVLRLKEKRGDSVGMARSLNNLGVIYSNQQKNDKSLELFERSMEIKLALGDSVTIAANFNNIGQVYYSLEDYGTAMEYFKSSVRIRKNAKQFEELISGYNNIAAAEICLRHPAEAIYYLNRAYEIADSIGVQNQLPIIMFNLGDIFYDRGDINAAVDWYKKALEFSVKLNNYQMQFSINQKMSEIYEAQNDFKEALYYKDRAMITSDTITLRNADSKIEQLQFKYDAKRTELENVALKQDRELSAVELIKVQTKSYLLIILASLALIIIVLVINRYSLKIRHNKQLHKEVELRNKSLLREIDERKRLQSQQKLLGKHFVNIFSNSPLAIISLNAVGEIQLVNDAFAAMAGLGKDVLAGSKIQTVINNVEFLGALHRALDEGSANFTGKLNWEHSSEMYGRVFINFYKPEDESLVDNTFVIIEDVSEDCSAEERLKASELRYYELADSLPEMLFETDLNAKVTFANKIALEMFGFSLKDIEKGVSIFDFFVGDERELLVRRFTEFIVEKKTTVTREYEIKNKFGKTLSVISTINLLRENDIPTGFRGVLVDISHRSGYEKSLLAAKEKAEKADRLKTMFLQSLSHEIRTPMNGILGFSELIKYEEMSDEERNSYIDIIIDSSNQLLSIIDDIVNLSHIETGDVVVHKHEVVLSKFFNDLMVYFHGYLMNRNDQIVLRLNNKVPQYAENVVLVEKQVQHVLSNLIYNAVTYTKKGFIEIGVEKNGDVLQFYVKDTGIGISKDLQQGLFNRFMQKEQVNQKRQSGLGIGLAIAKGLVDLLGGTIAVESVENEGSTFYFTVPYVGVVPKKIDATSSDLTKLEYPDWSGRMILVVEDDMNNFLFLEQLLKKTKVGIQHLMNGKEAVDYLKANKPADLVLMDIQMPVMDGYEATQIIRTFNKDLPILAQTANAMMEDKTKSIDAGCDDYIAKPVNKKVLIKKIAVLFG